MNATHGNHMMIEDFTMIQNNFFKLYYDGKPTIIVIIKKLINQIVMTNLNPKI